MYSLKKKKKRHKDTEKKLRDENIAEHFKILKKTFFKSARFLYNSLLH